LVKSAYEEVLLIFPTTNAFMRQHKMGVVQLAIEAAQERNVKVRILMPHVYSIDLSSRNSLGQQFSK
jgi:hypothetical protein